MKKIFFLNLILLFITQLESIEAQNLVPNPSFEDTISCPDFPDPVIESASNWTSFRGTSDCFNSCNTQQFWGVPYNVAGYQNALIGNAYGGLVTWEMGASSPIREYMGVELIQPLIIGTKYYLSCFISNADSSPNNSSTNKFSFRFSTVSYSFFGNQAPIDNFSHFHSDSVVTDKINWTRIAGSFIADSAYHYLILGNFYDNSNTIIDTSFSLVGTMTSYYFIDAVCVSMDSIFDAIWTGKNDVHEKDELIVFPNPAKDNFYINNTRELKNLVIQDWMGNEIYAGKLLNGSNQINISEFATGIYLLAVDRKYYFKLIVEH